MFFNGINIPTVLLSFTRYFPATSRTSSGVTFRIPSRYFSFNSRPPIISNSASSRIESNDGTSLIIRGDGSAVFTDVVISTGDLTVTDGTESIILDASGWGSTQATIIFDVGATSQEPEITGSKSGGGLTLSAGGAVNNTQIKLSGGSNTIDFEINGADRWKMDQNVLRASSGTGAIRVNNGSAGTPTFSFVFDTNSGFYSIAGDRIGVATGGAFEWEWKAAGEFTNVLGGSTSASNTTQRTLLGVPGGLNIFIRSSGQTIIAGRNSDGGVVDFRRSGTQVGTISVTSSATAYNTSSDRRLKKQIRSYVGGLAVIRRIDVREGRWIKRLGEGEWVGMVAQELNEVLPEAVSSPDEHGAEWWSIDYGRVTPWLISAMQEIDDRVTDIERNAAA